jgi:hypothetical protein
LHEGNGGHYYGALSSEVTCSDSDFQSCS